MKSKTKGAIKKAMGEEQGLVIIEAVIVFPVMFFVLFFIIFIGNMYYELSRIDSIVMRNAVEGANAIADPFLINVKYETGIPTDSRAIDPQPYRYILGSISKGAITTTEDKISTKVKKEINDSHMIFFANQKVNILGSDNSKIAKCNNYVVYTTFVVQVNYSIQFPIRFFGDSSPTIAKLCSRAEVSVNDSPEFIRNIDMICDILDGTSTGNTIKGFFDKIGSFIEKFSGG